MEAFKKKKLPLLIAGAGGGGGGGSSSPKEADDTVNSRAMSSILDLLGEGILGGLIDGAKSIFIDGTPLQNADGSYNRTGVTWWFRDGSPDQDVIEGFDFIETPKSINLQLKKTNPVTFSVDNDDADRVRIIMKFPSLRTINKKTGDTSGITVQYRFQISNGNNTFQDVIAEGESDSLITLAEKRTGNYYRSYTIALPKPGSKYSVRVVRVTDDHNDNAYLYDDTYVDSVGEIVDTALNYPNSALVGIKVNSEQFGNTIPTRSYLVKGMKIRVPSNYSEADNTYQGTWDGTFQLLSSDNPAWILFDLLTNERYGLGSFVSDSMIDLSQIYQIGRYCDEEVDDGFGGTEKRFAINTQITSRQDAYRVIQDIAGAFRGMIFWAGGMVQMYQDAPSDPAMLFSNSNVIDGKFVYKGTSRKDRPSVALITYNNKDDGYKQNVEYVEDQEAIKRYGIRKTESVAFGCTSRGQAHRVGLWTLYTARMESDVITFSAGMDASFLMPGETILIQNKYRAGRRNSGRIVSFTKTSITLDAPVDMTTTGFINFPSAEGNVVERDILESGSTSTITFKTPLSSSEEPALNAIWMISQTDLVPMQARVVKVSQADDGVSYEISAVQNNPTKYEAIDNGASLLEQNTTVLDPTFSKPSNLAITEGTYLSSPGNLSVMLTATWEGRSSAYMVSWRRSDDEGLSNWVNQRVTEEQFELRGVAEDGQYDFQVYAISVGGRNTDPISITYKVLGTLTPPAAPTSLSALGDYRAIVLNWVNPDSVDLDHIEVLASQTNDSTTAKLLAKVTSTNFTHSGLEDSVTWYYWVRAVNKRGMQSPLNSNLGTSATTRDVLSFLTNKITESELGQDLLSDLDSKATSEAVDNAINEVKQDIQSQVDGAKQETSDLVAATKNDLNNAITKEASDRADAIANEAAERTDALQQEAADRAAALSQEAEDRAAAISTAVADEATDRAKAIAKEASDRAAAITSAVALESQNRDKAIAASTKTLSDSIAQEASDRAKAVADLDTKAAEAIAQEADERSAAVENEAKARADAILSEQNEREAAISNVSTLLQTATDSLAQQISQVAAGTGEQFDSKVIWYFDTSNEGWTEDDGSTTPMTITDDGWLKAANSTSTARSPNGMDIDAAAYRFIKLRLKKVGSPTWKGRLLWVGTGEQGWVDGRTMAIDEPAYDEYGIATLTMHDIPWNDSISIRRFRLDLTQNQDDNNYFLFDWIAVGRPTPGAGMAALQDEQTARANADAVEASNRQTLATQIRGSYDGTDLSKVSSGLIYQEQQARVTADKAEAAARQSLQTEVNDSISAINKSLDTLNTEQEAQASDITDIKSSLGDKADASALQSLSTKVTDQGNQLASQGSSITQLQNSLTATNQALDEKAEQSAVSSLEGRVTKTESGISAANSDITNLQSSLNTTNDNLSKKADASAVSDLTSRVSSTEDEIASQGDSITQLNNSLSSALSDVDASGRIPGNLVINPSFERDLDGYINVSANISVAEIQAPHYGTRALKVDTGSATPGQNIDFVKDRTYEIGVWVKQIAGTADNGAGNNKIRIGNSAGAPVLEIPISSAGTSWTKFSKTWKATETGSLPVTLSNYLTTGSRYFDDFYVVDVSDRTSIDANSSAISSLQNTVTQQGKTLTSQSTSIENLQNSLSTTNTNLANKADASTVSTLQNTVEQQGKDISSQSSALTNLQNSLSSMSIGGTNLIRNADTLDGWNTRIDSETYLGDRVAYNKLAKGASGYTQLDEQTIDVTGRTAFIYSFYAKGAYDGQEMATYFYNPSDTLSTETSQGTKSGASDGKAVIKLTTEWARYWVKWTIPATSGTKRLIPARLESASTADKQVWLCRPQLETGNVMTDWSPNPDDAASSIAANTSAITGLTSRVTNAEGELSSQSSDITSLQNSLLTTNEKVSQKADATAVSSLQNTVTQQGKDLESASSNIADLQNSLSETNDAVEEKADQSALDSLTGRVTKTESGITAANTNITSLTASVKAGAASGGDLIPNPTFDPAYNQMGYTVVASDSDGVPAGAPTSWVAKLASRDHVPTINNIPCHEGQVFEISATVACGAGSVPFNLYIGTASQPAGSIGTPQSSGGQLSATAGASWTRTTWRWTVTAAQAERGYFRPFLQVNQSSPFGAVWYATEWSVKDVTAAAKAQSTADATATALDSLSNTVTQQGKDISSVSSRATSLENSLATTNANLANKADASALQSLQNTVSQQGNTLTTQGSNITDLSNSLQAIVNKGDNLVQNSGFLQGETSYGFQRSTASTITMGNYGDGKVGARLVRTDGTSPGLFANVKKPVPQNGRRRYRFIVKAKGVSGAMNLLMRRWNYTGTTEGTYQDKGLTLTSDWQVYTWNTDLTPEGSFDGSSFGLYCHPANAEVWIDSFEVFDVTDEMSINVNTSAISSLTNTVTQQGKDISAQSNALTSLSDTVSGIQSDLNSKADASAVNALTTRVDAAEKSLSSQSDAVTSLTNTLNTVRNQGTNPWVDGTFESYSDGQVLGGSGTAVVVASQKFTGDKSLKLRRDENNGGNSDKQLGTWQSVREDAKFRFEFWAMMPADQAPSSGWTTLVGIQSQNAAGQNAWQAAVTVSEASLGARDKWVKFTGIASNNGAGRTRAVAWISTRGATGNGTPGYDLYIDDLVITEITDAKAAQDSANANASAIQSLNTAVTKNGDDINSQGSAITNLTNSLDATDAAAEAQVKTPGNMLYNSSFELGADGFTGWSSTATIYAAQAPNSGSKVLKMASGQSNLIGQTVSITQGRRYRFGVYAKQDADTVINDPGNTKFRIADDTGLLVGVNYGPFTSGWQHVSMEWTASKTTTAQFQLTTWLSAGAMYFDDVYVIDITDETNIKANSQAITSLNSAVSQQGNTLTSQSSAITNLQNSLSQLDKDLDSKADASAVDSLTSRVTTTEGKITSQGNQITQLNNGLSTANTNISKKADSSALQALENVVDQQGDELSSQSDAITNLNNSLNSVSVGGTNLLPNTATLHGVSGLVSGETFKNNAIKRLSITASSTASYDQLEYVLDAPFDTEECVLSFYAKASNDDSKQIYCYLYNPNATLTAESSQGTKSSWASGGDGSMAITLTTDWVRYWVKYTRKASQTGTARVIVGRLQRGSADKQVLISSPKLEEGTMPTAWTPAPADLAGSGDLSDLQTKVSANSSALQSVTSRVQTAEGTITSQGSAITNLQNSLQTTNSNVSQKADSSAVTSLANKVTQNADDIASNSAQTTMLQNSLASGSLIVNGGLSSDTSMWADSGTGSGFTYDSTEKALKTTTGSIRVANTTKIPVEAGVTLTLSFEFKTSETISGASSDTVGFIADLNSPTDWLTSSASWLRNVTSSWATATFEMVVPSDFTGNYVYLRFAAGSWSPATSARLYLRNVDVFLSTGVAGKADASALSDLSSKVTQQGNTLTSQGSAITQLQNGLTTTNANVSKKADQSALTALQGTVSQQGDDISSANSQITSLSASVKAGVASGGNLIPNPTFDPAYDQMGLTVVASSTSGVPADCPFGYVVKLAYRDHVPTINNIPCHEGQVFEFSVLAACGTGTAPFQHYLGTSTSVTGGTGSPQSNGGQITAAQGAQWTRTTWRWTVTAAQGAKGYFRPFLQIGQAGPDFGTVWYATDWSVRDVSAAAAVQTKADATATALDSLSSTVKTQGDSISSLGSRTTSLENGLKSANDTLSQKADASALQSLQNTVTQQGKDISTQSGNITSLQNSLATTNSDLANLQADDDASKKIVGNLITNPSFERGIDGYTGGASFFSVIDAQSPNSGSKILSCGVGTGNVTQSIAVTTGRTYKIGVFARCTASTAVSNSGNNKLRIGNTALLKDFPILPANLSTGSTWNEISGTWKATVTGNVDVSINSSLSSGMQYFDDFYFVDVTDSVNIDATSSAVASLTSRVTAAEGSVSSNTSSITNLNNSLTSLKDTVSKKADASALQTLQNTVTQQGNTLTSASGSITNLENSLTTLKNQTNPWVDGSFETYSNNQQLSGANCYVTTSQKFSGDKSLAAVRAAGETGNSDKTLGALSAIRESAVYRFECWVMMPSDQSPPSGWSALIGLMVRNSSDTAAWPTAITVTEATLTAGGGRGKWVKCTGTLNVGGSQKTRAQVWISTRGTSGGAGYALYIDDLVISDITDAAAAQTTANANASAISSLQTKVSDIDGQVTSQTSQLSSMQSKVDSASSKVDQLSQTISDSLSTQSSLNTSLQSQIDAQASANIKNQTDYNDAITSIATIKSTQSTQATQISAIAQSQTDLTSSVADQSASLQTLQETVANNDSLSSTWMVKMETNSAGQKYVAGIALGVDGKSQQSQFLVEADRLALINTSNGATTTPFVIDSGVTYMNAAFIKDGSITNAKIGNVIQSNNYVEGSSGWSINKDGGAQFNSVIVRGTVYADTGYFNGTVYANRIEGDVGSYAINVAQHRSRKVSKATWNWYELLRIRRQSFDQIIHIKGSLLQSDRIDVSGGGVLRAGMSYSSGSEGGLDPGYLSYAILMTGSGATSGGGSMELGIELLYENGDGATRLSTGQESLYLENLTFTVAAGSGDAVLRYGSYLDRNGQMVHSILSRFDAFASRNNDVVRAASSD
ncbi:TPA: phage tail tip fiber protein [Klebsiella variicola]